MRRIDVIGIAIGLFVVGVIPYFLLRAVGLNTLNAGVWSQLLFVGGLVGWLSTYFFRVVTKGMTYNQQVKDYEEAVLQKRLEELTPEELAQIQAEIEQEKK